MENAFWRILHFSFGGIVCESRSHLVLNRSIGAFPCLSDRAELPLSFRWSEVSLVIPMERSDEESESYDTGTTQHSD